MRLSTVSALTWVARSSTYIHIPKLFFQIGHPRLDHFRAHSKSWPENMHVDPPISFLLDPAFYRREDEALHGVAKSK